MMNPNHINDMNDGDPSFSGGASSSSAPTSSSSRGKNWTKLEDRQLCRSWLGAFSDSNTNNGQLAGKFWERITANFNQEHALNRAEGEKERSVRALNSRWTHIQYRVCIYTGVLEQAIREVSSDDIFVRAGELYTARLKVELEVDEEFKLQHCYQELRDQPRWIVQMNKLRAKLDKGKGRAINDTQENREEPRLKKVKRILPQKQINKRRLVLDEEVLEIQKRHAEIKRQRREDLATNCTIMNVDLDKCTNEKQKRFFGIWQALILKDLEDALGERKVNELLDIKEVVEEVVEEEEEEESNDEEE